MSIQIPDDVLEHARVSRVVTCLNCHMDVAPEDVDGMLSFACCRKAGFACRVCARLVGEHVWKTIAQAHETSCRARILAPAAAPAAS